MSQPAKYKISILTKTAGSIFIITLILTGCLRDHILDDEGKNRLDINNLYIRYQSSNWEERLEAVKEISNYADSASYDEIVIFLLRATYDEHSLIRIEALINLKRFRSGVAINRIMDIASSNKNSNERWYALQTLAAYRLPVSIPVFINGLKSKDWLIREASIIGLLMIRDQDTKTKLIPYYLKALRDPSDAVKIATLNNLDIRGRRLYNEIIKLFNSKKGKKHSIKLAAMKALRGYTLDDKTRERLIDLLTDRNEKIRIFALRVLKDEKSITK